MKNDRIIEFSLHMKVRNWSRPPSPRVNVENLSAVRRINSTISTRSNIDPRGEGDRRAVEFFYVFFHFSCCVKCESVSSYVPDFGRV